MNEADRHTAERHRAIWEEFLRRPEVTPWTGRADLPPEVTATVGFVIAVDGAAVRESLRAVVARLEATGCVAPFSPDYWHITVVPPALATAGEGVPPDLLPETFVEVALETGRRAVSGQGAFDVRVRGLNAFRDVVVAVPYDGGRGLELGRRLREALPQFPERYREGHEPLPHISLTQYAACDRLDEMVELLRRERDADLGSFRAERLEMFVVRWRDGVPGTVDKHPMPL